MIQTSSQQTARLWKIAHPRLLGPIDATVNEIRFSPDGHRLITILNSEARIFAIDSGLEIGRLRTEGDGEGKGRVNDASFSPDGNWVATAGSDHVVRVESLEDQRKRRLEGHEDEVTAITFSRDGKRLLSTGDDNMARLWDWLSEKELQAFPHECCAEAALSPEADRVLTSVDRSAKIWSLGDREPVILPHPDNVEGASFDPAGRRVVTASHDGTVRLWQANGKRLTELPLGDKALYGASFSPDGRSVVIWGEASTAYLWRPGSGNRHLELPGHNADLGSPSFTSNSQLVLTYDSDQIQAWDALSPYPRRSGELSLAGNGGTIDALSWNVDNLQLAVALTDRWDGKWLELHSCETCRPLDELVKLARKRLRPERRLTQEEQTTYQHMPGYLVPSYLIRSGLRRLISR